MSDIAVLGSGAFGTALAIALSRDGDPVTLWGRDPDVIARMASTREAGETLGRVSLPQNMQVTSDLTDVDAAVYLLAVPAQALRRFLIDHKALLGTAYLVACCKGIDRETGLAPVETIKDVLPEGSAFILTGPSFAVDIARGAPTALLLAGHSKTEVVQSALSRHALRLYRSGDVTGAELGGALKNVIALAAGMAVGAGFGDSARAALIARGFAEMAQAASAKGAELETVQGLAGLGDLVLTCTSEKSRNFVAGLSYGRGETPDGDKTVEGIATAHAMIRIADEMGLEMPITRAVARVCGGDETVADAAEILLQRPLKEE